MPPLPLLVRWLEHHSDLPPLHELPAGNGSLPDVLALAGIDRITLDEDLDLPAPSTWTGMGGASVVLSDAPEARPHRGALPRRITPHPEDHSGASWSLLDLARLEDATAVAVRGDGAAWEHIIGGVANGNLPRPPLTAIAGTAGDTAHHAWNPLPFARTCTVALAKTGRTAPWGFIDESGRTYPVQVIQGATGSQLLTLVPLGALESRSLATHDEPVAGAHWEITDRVLDNGIMRAEFSTAGTVQRLLLHQSFIDLAGPWMEPWFEGEALSGEVDIRVIESGPVRARVVVTHESRRGVLRTTYTCIANDDALQVTATWTGDVGRLWLRHPTSRHIEPLQAANDSAPWSTPQSHHVAFPGANEQYGVRWARLGSDACAPAFAAARPLSMRCEDGVIDILVEGPTSYCVAPASATRGGLDLGRRSIHLGLPARATAGPANPPLLRWAEAEELIPTWIRRPSGWLGELLLCEQSGRDRKALLMVEAEECLWADVHGTPRDSVAPTREGDGFQIHLPAHGIGILRWR